MRPKCPFVSLCFDPPTSRTKKRERKKGGQEILCMRRKKKKKFINSSIYPQHTIMVRDEINRPDTTKTHTITKNWRGKSKPTRNGSERKGCRWVWKEALVSNLHRRRKTKKKEKKRGEITNLDRFMRGREIWEIEAEREMGSLLLRLLRWTTTNPSMVCLHVYYRKWKCVCVCVCSLCVVCGCFGLFALAFSPFPRSHFFFGFGESVKGFFLSLSLSLLSLGLCPKHR